MKKENGVAWQDLRSGAPVQGGATKARPSQAMLELRDRESPHVFPQSIYPLTYKEEGSPVSWVQGIPSD